MSISEIKAQADHLTVEELTELGRFFREVALRKDPRRQAEIDRALSSGSWMVREEFERRLAEKDRAGQ